MRLRHYPALLSATILGLVSINFASGEPVRVNGIAAKVNGRVITQNELNQLFAPQFAQLSAQYPRRGEEFKKLATKIREDILEELIEREIILDEYKRLGATIPDSAVDNQIKREINHLYDGDKNKFNEELKKRRVTMNRYREMSKENMIIQAMRKSQFDDAAPPLPNEIRNEYNAVKKNLRDTTLDVVTYRKIFIPAEDVRDPAVTPEDQLKKAEDIVQKIKDGEDFAALAKQYSKDYKAEEGGLHEKVPRMDISAEFAAIIFDTKEGELIGPIEEVIKGRLVGYTIAIPDKIEFGPDPALHEVREEVENRVRLKKTSAQYKAWMEKLKDRAIIKRYL